MQLKKMRCEMKSESEAEIIRRLSLIEKLLQQQDTRPLNLVEASEYLSISQSYLYKLTRQKLIPCHKPTGKYLYFFRKELNEWIKMSLGYAREDGKRLSVTLDVGDGSSNGPTLSRQVGTPLQGGEFIRDPNQIEMELETGDEEPP